MKLCKAQIAYGFLFFVAAFPVFAQRGNIGIDAGETSDKFANLTRYSDPGGDVNGEVVVLRGGAKQDWPNVLAGGEFRFPSDTNHHSTEFALYGGLAFRVTDSFTAGFHVQVHKIYVPSSTVDSQTFIRNNMELLELPAFVEYKFGSGKKIFVRAEGAPEFRPRFRTSKKGVSPLPDPNLDHGYFVRGSLGYNFGKWYAKGSYETRYFKFAPDQGNPGGLNNWKSDFATVGVGLNF
jgi:hypothetical protein